MSGPLEKWFKVPTMTQRLRKLGIRDDVVDAAGLTAFGRNSDRALPSLARSLDPMESVIRILEGRWNRTIGLVVLTDHRLVLFPQNPSSPDLVVITRPDIVTAVGHIRRGQGVLTIQIKTAEDTAATVVIDQILGNQAQTMADSMTDRGVPDDTGSTPSATDDVLDQLAELRRRRHDGEIDEAEFERVKSQLFKQI